MSNEETKRKLLQKDLFRLAKGLVLLSKRTPFGMQKDSFWSAKGLHLLHSYKSMHYLHANICQNRVF